MCKCCRGSGSVLGGGMMELHCEECNGRGKVTVNDDGSKVEAMEAEFGDTSVDVKTQSIKMDKRSKAYKEAIKSIMDDTGFTREEAIKLFDEEMDKANEQD